MLEGRGFLLRILACFESKDIGLKSERFTDVDLAQRVGLSLVPGAAPYSKRWDPRDDFSEEADLGWIGEDSKGVWTTRHPNVSLLLYPRLWEIVDRFRYGDREYRREDYENLSAYELEARSVMLMADSRRARAKYGGAKE